MNLTVEQIEIKLINSKKDEFNKLNLIEKIGDLCSWIKTEDLNSIKINIGEVGIAMILACDYTNRPFINPLQYFKSAESIYSNLLNIIKDFNVDSRKMYLNYDLFEICNHFKVDFTECLNMAYAEFK